MVAFSTKIPQISSPGICAIDWWLDCSCRHRLINLHKRWILHALLKCLILPLCLHKSYEMTTHRLLGNIARGQGTLLPGYRPYKRSGCVAKLCTYFDCIIKLLVRCTCTETLLVLEIVLEVGLFRVIKLPILFCKLLGYAAIPNK